MQVKKVTIIIPETALNAINAISKLYNNNKPININQIAKSTNSTWSTIQKQIKNNFNIQGA